MSNIEREFQKEIIKLLTDLIEEPEKTSQEILQELNEMDEEFKSFAVVVDAVFEKIRKTVNDSKIFDHVARIKAEYVIALVNQGFTREEAIQILLKAKKI